MAPTLTPIRFTSSYGAYRAGEIAGFTADEAKIYVERHGVAEYYVPGKETPAEPEVPAEPEPPVSESKRRGRR